MLEPAWIGKIEPVSRSTVRVALNTGEILTSDWSNNGASSKNSQAEIVTDQSLAALRSLVEMSVDKLGDASTVDLYFGPEQPDRAEGRWIKTSPTEIGSFVRIYGPDAPAFDGTWRLQDFETLD
jgi:hypothetical protein